MTSMFGSMFDFCKDACELLLLFNKDALKDISNVTEDCYYFE